jgi:beta-phosphoglucomutase
MQNQIKNYKAFLFDLNGTMIDDMRYHIKAWHRIATSWGADITMERTKQECYGKNGDFLERVFPGRFSDEEKEAIGAEKEKGYQAEFRAFLKLIDGLDEFLAEAKSNDIKTAIGTAAIRSNVDFVLDGLAIGNLFDAIVCADDVTHSKPHPETFLKCAAALSTSPKHCLVFEDTPKGVEAAQHAGMDAIVITTLHRPEEFTAYKNIVGFIHNYYDDQLSYICPKAKI